jgi:hypothetical protein
MRYFIFLVFISLFSACQKDRNGFVQDKNRPNITFIVGEDRDEENHYYAAAKKYYLTHDIDNQSIVIDYCRSLKTILDFLSVYKTKENKPLGIINIVAHGNEWNGLKMPILPNGKERTNTITLKNALKNNLLQVMKNGSNIDEQTQLHIQGCAVGKDENLLSLMQEVFGGRLQVYSPQKFVLYQPDNQRYLADYFYSFQHPDSSFQLAPTVQQLRERHASEPLDWRMILTTTRGNDPKKPFSYKFKIPVHWTVNFSTATEIPSFQNQSDFEQWLFQQTQLMRSLEKMKLPKNAFRWTYFVANNSLKISGLSQVTCVLKPEN